MRPVGGVPPRAQAIEHALLARQTPLRLGLTTLSGLSPPCASASAVPVGANQARPARCPVTAAERGVRKESDLLGRRLVRGNTCCFLFPFALDVPGWCCRPPCAGPARVRGNERAANSHGSPPLPCARWCSVPASRALPARCLTVLPSASCRQPEYAHAGYTTLYQDGGRGSYEGRARTNPAGAGPEQRCPAAGEPR